MRETPVRPGSRQLTCTTALRKVSADWVQWQTWSAPMSGQPRDYISEMSVQQRNVFGTAAPGDKYWTPDTIKAVAQRYQGMDTAPYAAALGASKL